MTRTLTDTDFGVYLPKGYSAISALMGSYEAGFFRYQRKSQTLRLPELLLALRARRLHGVKIAKAKEEKSSNTMV